MAERSDYEAEILRRAAGIIRRRSTRPGFVLDVYCKVLTKMADAIEPGAAK